MLRRPLYLALFFIVSVLPGRAINIVFDYSDDTNNFFANNPTAKTDLEAAGQFFDSRLSDSLTAINSSGSNSWTATFTNPSTGNSTSVTNPSIAANEILIYVGGLSLSGSTLGEGGPGGYSASGSQSWLNTVAARGQTGALASTPTDFGPWGGSVQFNSSASWYFDPDPSTNESFSANDFYSVALHEIGHVLGLGTAGSWNADVSSGTFTGANSKAANGGVAVSLSADLAHWATGTMSTIYGTSTAQETAMSPALTTGTRKVFTTLDMAGLKDVGWIVVPEPSSGLLLLGVIAVSALRRRV
ncbi:MAG: matrixin family metalloprotease [Chthoniobacteraceae bacterium]